MKKLLTLLILSILFQIKLVSQSCLPEGITFTNQQQIDNFTTTYPDCTEIEGDVLIRSAYINNLSGLNVLTYIGGDLEIGEPEYGESILLSVAGLSNLDSIGGNLYILGNSSLNSLNGLENVNSVGGDLIITTYSLTSLYGLNGITNIGGYFEVFSNYSLINLNGINNLDSIGNYLLIGYNLGLTSLSGLENLSFVGEDMWIVDNYDLLGLDSLYNLTTISGNLMIRRLTSLNSLEGLENISLIGGYLKIYENNLLSSLSGIDNIAGQSISDLYIFDNMALSICEVESVCEYLADPNGLIEVYNNKEGCNSQEQIEVACAMSYSEINKNTSFKLFPNPAANKLSIKYQNQTITAKINIYNQLGTRILKTQSYLENIDISGLENGVYFVEIELDKIRTILKLVINR